jgi:nitrogen fixation-related uncharacterized protein
MRSRNSNSINSVWGIIVTVCLLMVMLVISLVSVVVIFLDFVYGIFAGIFDKIKDYTSSNFGSESISKR